MYASIYSIYDEQQQVGQDVAFDALFFSDKNVSGSLWWLVVTK